jgi:2-succinyl-6-hydroxy-2,4-cyclohexadiene-1-carboxylate synthase
LRNIVPEAFPSLYLHGFAGHPDEARGMNRSYFGVQMPGHGSYFDGGSCSIAVAKECVYRAVKTSGCSQMDLIAYSMGSRVALSMAVENPPWLRRLVLIGVHPGLEGKERMERSNLDKFRATALESQGVAAFMDQWESIPLLATQSAISEPGRSRMQDARRSHTALGLASSLREMGTGTMPSLWDQVAGINLPVLLVTGSEDPKFDAIAKRLLRLIPKTRHVVIDGAGHCAHLEQPEAFSTALSTFLDGPLKT